MRCRHTRLRWLVALALLGAAPQARAELHFPAQRVNLGEIRCGAKRGCPFRFVNRGAEPVEILEARPGCGCLLPRLERLLFRPGEVGRIPVEVNARGQSAGPHTWRLLLRYRAGAAEREVTLEVAAQVVTEVTVQPAALTVLAAGPVSHDILLTDLRPQPLSVTRVAVTAPYLSAHLGERHRDGLGHWVWRVRLEVGADCPEGRHSEALTLYTSDPEYGELQVPLTLVRRARSRLSATPGRVALSLLPGQATVARSVRLADRQGGRVVVEEVTAADPAISCQRGAGPDGCPTLRIQVERTRLKGAALDSAVRVRVSAPVAETVVIPVSCTAEGDAP
jgi:hypothetical protein